MDDRRLRQEIAADLYRIDRKKGVRALFREYFRNAVFRYIVLWRVRGFLKNHPLRFGAYHLVLFLLLRATYRLGIRIPQETEVGPGLYMPHFGGIWVDPKAVIGRNCNLSQGVTLGGLHAGENRGAPILGKNVYVGPNATILGQVTIGNNALIGANSLILTDVPESGVMIGVPAKLFSVTGSAEYVHNTDYEGPNSE